MNRRLRRQERALERLQAHADAELSVHAVERADELGFSRAEVLSCVAAPEQTYVCPDHYGSNRRMYQRGQMAVVLHEPSRLIVTVLLRQREVWTHGRHTRRTMAGAASGSQGRPIPTPPRG